MQRRAIRDAKTPDKMKKSKTIKEDSNLSLQEKKEKIQSGLKKLTELGTVDPKNRYQELINDIARVWHLGENSGLAMLKAISEACGDTGAVPVITYLVHGPIQVLSSRESLLTLPACGPSLDFHGLFHGLN